ncbi:Immunity protein 35 [Filimonas lacunae]|uniref:Immunity protein 35 n=1 Tax=Filimonas lacunae TaxID=477680 RepID=A0A173MIK4_9BACT|nr:YrhB domain-containing protein [Filimonas lacunae]BAV07238.1 hypothetical protein FLA_3261 [Filimonas lacunae]SIS92754.1 Immunity protein 35 [Filimonas lacunae]
MLSLEQARQIAEQKLQQGNFTGTDDDLLVISEVTEIIDAWIFSYTSKKLLETGDTLKYGICGNAPFFISKTDGSISTFGTSFHLETMIKLYAEERNTWKLRLVNFSFNNVHNIYKLKNSLNLSFADIKQLKESNASLIDKGDKERLTELSSVLHANGIESVVTLD